ncbi:hypothetical protein E0485_12700 [Paenibacillus albiflavus]|uniref:Glycosyltransferase n=1 Tax=Paenibacillus albiflavus TaxID=2545760 RepID=A0A4R4EAF5_9BACL|nr:hypothetical protein [Paenibacillus albiflavus]TCZ76836.1 hypothetical protein E0485_12700 [Paenibacillus albiflavus]
MWIVLLSIVGSYALCVLLLHWLYGVGKLQSVPPTRILLITNNNQKHIEWVLRSIFFRSNLRGTNIRTTIVDKSSTDDTIKIVERLSHKHPLEIHQFSPTTPLEEVMLQYPKDATIFQVNRID